MGKRRKQQIVSALKEWGTSYEDSDSCEPSSNQSQ
jgi:hypothetical protein